MHQQIGKRPNCLSVLMDNHEIGRIAAEHFKSLGRFAAYAFIPAPPKIPWSLPILNFLIFTTMTWEI